MSNDKNMLERIIELRRAKTREDFEEESFNMLIEQLEKYMKTIMVGSLSAVEKHLGDLWSHGSQGKLSPEQLLVKGMFDKARKEILDLGNNQIKKMKDMTAEDFSVFRKKFSITLPVVSEGSKDEKRS